MTCLDGIRIGSGHLEGESHHENMDEAVVVHCVRSVKEWHVSRRHIPRARTGA
jgi:hypothetical protein